MSKYMCTHKVPSGVTREQVCELADAAQHDEHVRGYRSFLNLSEGKAVCIFEAESADAVAEWFDKMDLSYEDITLVELEGECGVIHDALPATVGV